MPLSEFATSVIQVPFLLVLRNLLLFNSLIKAEISLLSDAALLADSKIQIGSVSVERKD